MKSRKIIIILVIGLIDLFLSHCKTEEIILHGEIIGTVTDTITSQPIPAAKVKLSPVNDTTSTDIEGEYLFKSIKPGNYVVKVSKEKYAEASKYALVNPASTTETNFAILEIPIFNSSKPVLDFELELNSLSFTISKTGPGRIPYTLTPSKNWITIDPMSGDIDTEIDSITVTINREGLGQNIIKEFIRINSTFLQYNMQDTIGVYLNGVVDEDLNYYKIVKIGAQIWMAENLNVGKMCRPDIPGNQQSNNGIIERYCFNNDANNCSVWGGLYTWNEAMQYNPPDLGAVGTTQGICPEGWHIPTCIEWSTLIDYFGGEALAGAALKETGTNHWDTPNEGATNESGFTGIGGGYYQAGEFGSRYLEGWFWGTNPSVMGLYWRSTEANTFGCHNQTWWGDESSFSVRCIRNP